jgi:quercetin dioxygenase-like cupin family protein
MYIRKSILTALAVVAIGAGWLAKTIAQENSSSSVITYFDHEKVDASFTKEGGGVLAAGQSGRSTYKVLTAQRAQADEAEIHSHDLGTGVLYVMSGGATFVNRGTAVAAKTTAPGESGGQSIRGGESRRLSKGDVLIVPPDAPHSYRNVEAPFRYFGVICAEQR